MKEDVGGGAADEKLERRGVGRRPLAGTERESQSAGLRQQLDGRRIAESARLVARECERWQRIARIIERRVAHGGHHKQLCARAKLYCKCTKYMCTHLTK